MLRLSYLCLVLLGGGVASGCGAGTADSLARQRARLAPPPRGSVGELGVFHAGTVRSEVDLHWLVRDPNTSYTDRSTTNLWVALTVEPSGAAILRVRHVEAKVSRFLGPYTRGRGNSTVQDAEATDSWHAKVMIDAGETHLLVDTRLPDSPLQELRCQRIRDDGPEYVQCAPILPFVDLPSKDRLPAYLRTPLVFGAEARLHVTVVGDHAIQNVSVTPIP